LPPQDDVPESILPVEPAPGAIVSERPLEQLGGLELMLSNGMRVVGWRGAVGGVGGTGVFKLPGWEGGSISGRSWAGWS
jgi:hypothetical protein